MTVVSQKKQDKRIELEHLEQVMLDTLSSIKKQLSDDITSENLEISNKNVNTSFLKTKEELEKNIADLKIRYLKKEEDLEKRTKERDELKNMFEDLKKKYHDTLDVKSEIATVKKKLNQEIEKNKTYESRVASLKQLLVGQKEFIKRHKEELLKRDELIKTANEQLVTFAEEKKVLNIANEQLLAKISQMKTIIDKLNSDLALRAEEIKTVRSLMIAEKNNEKARLRQKLLRIAKAETKKEVLVNARIAELMDVIAKQKEVINEFVKTDIELENSFKLILEDTKNKRSEIDYSIVKKEFEELPLDNASISRLVEEMTPEAEASSKNNVSVDKTSNLADAVRTALQNGDPPEVIKQSLITSGNNEQDVVQTLKDEATKLNIEL